VNVGVADLPPINISKTFDAASVYLMQSAVAGGSVGDNAQIHFLFATANGEQKLFLEFKLNNPIIASWSITGPEDERPTEEITLWYWKVWMQYYQYDGKTVKAAGSRGWDRTTNTPWNG
jgi:type VI secretion system secreted protein Hcp